MRYLLHAVFLFFGFAIVAQQQTISSKMTVAEIQKEAKSGHFQWIFPTGTTSESIDNLAKYYATSFSYTFNAASKCVDVFPVVDSENTRRVMLRFLGANQVNQILVGNETLALYAFYEKFMKYEGQ
jgi:hypothetical protein